MKGYYIFCIDKQLCTMVTTPLEKDIDVVLAKMEKLSIEVLGSGETTAEEVKAIGKSDHIAGVATINGCLCLIFKDTPEEFRERVKGALSA